MLFSQSVLCFQLFPQIIWYLVIHCIKVLMYMLQNWTVCMTFLIQSTFSPNEGFMCVTKCCISTLLSAIQSTFIHRKPNNINPRILTTNRNCQLQWNLCKTSLKRLFNGGNKWELVHIVMKPSNLCDKAQVWYFNHNMNSFLNYFLN